ncbi:MAG: two pore domain potassium channel family protein [Candidatus Eisenbacteria sp.]|nr:two pore domain potassium channel family protein [Candidatus Eisenbacteria bacterium]
MQLVRRSRQDLAGRPDDHNTSMTVGYGDAHPATGAGKFFASLVAILGIGMFALPTGTLGAGFIDEIRRGRMFQRPKRCPNCGPHRCQFS